MIVTSAAMTKLLVATYRRSSFMALVIWFSTVFSDRFRLDAISRYFIPCILAITKISRQRPGSVDKAASSLSSTAGSPSSCPLTAVYRHYVATTLTQERNTAVSNGSGYVRGKLVLGHVVELLVPHVDKKFLDNVLRVVPVGNISIGYAAQPRIMFQKSRLKKFFSTDFHHCVCVKLPITKI